MANILIELTTKEYAFHIENLSKYKMARDQAKNSSDPTVKQMYEMLDTLIVNLEHILIESVKD